MTGAGTPWFHAALRGGRLEAAGTARAELGHRLPDSGGVFAGWRWDGATLAAWNDRLGFHPLFCCATEHEVWISPSAALLVELGAPAHPDLDALAVFARLGFFVGDDTPFQAVRALPPGAVLSWARGVLRVEEHRPVGRPAAVSRAAALDGLVTLFRAAVARRADGAPSVVPLSGGRDSRHILLELCAQGVPPRACLTGRKLPPDRGDDPRIGRMVAERAGVAHRRVPRPPSRFHAERRANAAQGMCSDEGAWFLPLAGEVRAARAVCWDGIGGDVLTQSRFMDPATARVFASGAWEALADRLLAAGRTDAWLARLRPPPALHGVLDRERAVARLARELARHGEAASPTSSFFFWNRTRRKTALVPWTLLAGTTVHAPFLDDELFGFLASVPEEVRADGALHTDAIRRAYPAFADVPFAPRAAPPRHGAGFYAHWLRYTAELAAYAALRRPGWLRPGGPFPALLADARRPGGARAAHRLVPLVLYLLQLQDLVEPPGTA